MPAGSYTPDSRGMRELGMSPEIGAAMVDAAEDGKRWAESAAPVDSGLYRDSFRVEPAVVQAGRRNEDRQGAELINTAPYSHIVESRHHVLTRAVNAIEAGF